MTKILEGFLPQHLVLPGLRIAVIDGPDRGKQTTAQRGSVRVGSSDDNDLVLTDESVSRRHFVIKLRQHEVMLEDVGSTNGTRIDGVRVAQGYLQPGSTIQVGSTTLRAQAIEEPVVIRISNESRFGGLLGDSVEMRRVFAVLERVAPSDATVLVEGETGTGKDVAAEAIHQRSSRAEGPFIGIDCGAIAKNLIESELFGHVRGAFTGATADRRGAFEEAHGGTLFLDEIGELPLELQPKLLRVLETRQIQRLGETKTRPVDVRIVAATNRNLQAEVNRGAFREDLYFRLAVIRVGLPPLRARMDDVPMLARHFYERFSPGNTPTDDMLRALMGRAYPGNVRELRNVIERMCVVEHHDDTRPDTSSPTGRAPTADSLLKEVLVLPIREAQERWDEWFTESYLRDALVRSQGSVSGAARLTGTSRRYIQRLMRRYDIRASDDD